MTMMNSDSESQDSDEGRRFRFEATRKDSNSISLNSQYSKTLPLRLPSRRSRSNDRSKYDRKDDKLNYERKKEFESSKDEKRSVKDRKIRDELKKKDNTKYRDDSRYRYSHKDSWELGKKTLKSGDTRDSKTKDNRRKNVRERSYEKNRESESQKNSERSEQKYSKDREKSNRRSKFGEDNTKNRLSIEKKLDHNSDNLDDDRISIEARDCEELNLSDFEVVSNVEELSDSSIDEKKFRKSNSDYKDRKLKKKSRNKKIKSPKNENELDLDFHCSDDDLSDSFMNNASTSASASASSSHNFQNDNFKNLRRNSDDKISNESCNDNDEDKKKDTTDEDEECYGPSLPPSLVKSTPACRNKPKIIGPCLPDNFCQKLAQENDKDTEIVNSSLQTVKTIGPVLPDHLKSTLQMECEEDTVEKKEDEKTLEDDILGPLPADHPDIENDHIQQQLEYRARLIKKELARMDYKEEKKREEWMTELPSVHAANLGIGPRKFRSKEGPDMSDRSGWTDTPADREKKRKDMLMANVKVQENEEVTKKGKSSKRDGESLLDMHQKKMHKKKKKEEKKAKKAGTNVRRPFDRDVDLKVTRLDEAQKKSFIMSAQSLDSRFARGNI